MPYDPFDRGVHPVGVRTLSWNDLARGRPLPCELWYPAEEEHRGRDLAEGTRDRYQVLPMAPATAQDAVRDAVPAPSAEPLPLLVFSHGFGGHRRQTTHLCTHLASHGYAVVAVDHTGNTVGDMMQLALAARGGSPAWDAEGAMGGFLRDRPADLSFAIDRVLEDSPSGLRVDADRIGVSGHSFGGWTSLAVAARDPRVRAALPLAPAGGETPLTPENPFRDALDLESGREVPTLFLVADRDTLLPLAGMHELRARTRGAPRMVVLRDADHMHFCDRVEETHEMMRSMAAMASAVAGELPVEIGALSGKIPPMAELSPGDHAYAVLRALGLAHLDAHLRDRPEAAAFLEDDVEDRFESRGIRIEVV